VAAVLVISRGLLNAGVVDAISRYLAKMDSRLTVQVAVLTGIVVLCSGFMNNVGALALLMPVAIWMSRQSGRSPSLQILQAVAIFGAAMAAAAFNILPVQVAFLIAAMVMILIGLISVKEVYESIDWPIIVLLGAMFPLGNALETTGGAHLVAEKMILFSDHFHPVATLAVLMTGTMLLSNVVNNAAAAVLMAPIAIHLAKGMNVSVDPLLMAVAIGASCAFLTPVGHQSNALVMAPGGYRFGDYWLLGLPLSILVIAVAVPMIVFFWPF
jgi:di/tricarboxylate transporter